jgi:hypothetical protein
MSPSYECDSSYSPDSQLGYRTEGVHWRDVYGSYRMKKAPAPSHMPKTKCQEHHDQSISNEYHILNLAQYTSG